MTEQKNQVTRAAPEQSNDYRVVVFGAGGVGKSSLVLRFIKGTFRESYIPTIEDTYRQVSVQLGSFFSEILLNHRHATGHQLQQEHLHAANHGHHGIPPVPGHAEAVDLKGTRLYPGLLGVLQAKFGGAATHLGAHQGAEGMSRSEIYF